MDAMTHCVEAYTNCHSHPVVDMFALEGISLIGGHLEAACKNGNDFKAREALSLGSLYGGFCLGPVNTAAVHALAYPLGGEFKISHGVSNSVLLPFIMQYNLPSCTEKYSRIGRILGASHNLTREEQAKQAILRIRSLSERCGIPGSLRELKIPGEAIPDMAEAAMKVTRLLANNPRTLNREDAELVFQQAYQGTIDIKEGSK
jgi:alcohol dehydrogenase class IV